MFAVFNPYAVLDTSNDADHTVSELQFQVDRKFNETLKGTRFDTFTIEIDQKHIDDNPLSFTISSFMNPFIIRILDGYNQHTFVMSKDYTSPTAIRQCLLDGCGRAKMKLKTITGQTVSRFDRSSLFHLRDPDSNVLVLILDSYWKRWYRCNSHQSKQLDQSKQSDQTKQSDQVVFKSSQLDQSSVIHTLKAWKARVLSYLNVEDTTKRCKYVGRRYVPRWRLANPASWSQERKDRANAVRSWVSDGGDYKEFKKLTKQEIHEFYDYSYLITIIIIMVVVYTIIFAVFPGTVHMCGYFLMFQPVSHKFCH